MKPNDEVKNYTKKYGEYYCIDNVLQCKRRKYLPFLDQMEAGKAQQFNTLVDDYGKKHLRTLTLMEKDVSN